MSVYASHPGAALMKKAGAFTPKPDKAILDAAEEARKQELLDAAGAAAASFAATEIRAAAISALQTWAGTAAEDLDEGESLADRLLAMAVGIADENKDGDISEDEAEVVDIALNAMADYLAGKGVTDADILALLEDGDSDAAGRVSELLSGELGESDDGGDADLDGFVFDAETSEDVLDSILDAVYKKKMVVRKGKKVRINKRVSGKVRLSAKQKVAIRKAGMKSRSAGARVRRLKSMKIRRRLGM